MENTNDELEKFMLNFSRCGNHDVVQERLLADLFSLQVFFAYETKTMLHVLVFSSKAVEISSICIPKREPRSVCANFAAEHRVPRDRVTFGQQQESRLLVRPDILSMGRVLVLYS